MSCWKGFRISEGDLGRSGRLAELGREGNRLFSVQSPGVHKEASLRNTQEYTMTLHDIEYTHIYTRNMIYASICII